MSAVAQLEKHLSDLGIQLERVRKRRMKTASDIRSVYARIEAEICNRGHLNKLIAPLRKSEGDDGLLIITLEKQIDDEKRRLDLARAQSASVARAKAMAESANLPRDKFFDVVSPDGRLIRHKAHSLDTLRAVLLPGYSIVAEIFGTSEAGFGGFAISPGSRESLKAALSAMAE